MLVNGKLELIGKNNINVVLFPSSLFSLEDSVRGLRIEITSVLNDRRVLPKQRTG